MGAATHQELLLTFAEEFMRLRPEIDVTPVFQGTYGTLYQKLIAAVTARHPPALAMMYEAWTTRLLYRNRLAPVQQFADGPGGFSPAEVEDFYPAFLADNSWDGSLVTMPFNKSAYLLQYNVDLLRRAGFEQPPRTRDELRETAEAVAALKTEDGRACVGLLIRPQLEAFATLHLGAGGAFIDGDGNPLMQTPLARESLGFLRAMIDSGAARVDPTYPSVRFGAGNVGMFIYSSAAFPFNDRFSDGKFQWRAAPVPSPEGISEARRRALFQGMNVGLFAGHSPEESAAAWEFLKYMLEPEQAARWSMLTGYCPVRRSVLAVPAYREYLETNPNMGVAIAEIDRASFEPKPDFWESWRGEVGDQIAAALQGFKTVDQALADAQRAGEDALKYDSKFAAPKQADSD